MAIGVGATFINQKNSPGGSITGADNGLLNNAGIIEMGAPLIRATGIDIAGNSLMFWDSFRNYSLIELDPAANRYTFGIYDLTTTVQNAWSFEADTAILYAGSLSEAMRVEQSSKTYTIGDLQNAIGGLIALLDNNNFLYSIRDAGSANRYLLIDKGSMNFMLGDIDTNNNGCLFEIDDTNTTFRMFVNGSHYFQVDTTTGNYSLGDYNNIHNGAYIRVDDSNEVVIIENTVGNMKLQLNGVNGITGSYAVGGSTIEVNGGIITNIF